MMNRIRMYILSFLLTSLITLNGYAQEANGDRVGFSSLFTVVKADTQANATQYQLNPKAVFYTILFRETRSKFAKNENMG